MLFTFLICNFIANLFWFIIIGIEYDNWIGNKIHSIQQRGMSIFDLFVLSFFWFANIFLYINYQYRRIDSPYRAFVNKPRWFRKDSTPDC